MIGNPVIKELNKCGGDFYKNSSHLLAVSYNSKNAA